MFSAVQSAQDAAHSVISSFPRARVKLQARPAGSGHTPRSGERYNLHGGNLPQTRPGEMTGRALGCHANVYSNTPDLMAVLNSSVLTATLDDKRALLNILL